LDKSWAPYCDAIFSEIGFEVESRAELAVVHFESGVSRIGRADLERGDFTVYGRDQSWPGNC